MIKSVFVIFVFAMLFTLASAEEIAAPWKNIEDLKPPNGRVAYFALEAFEGQSDIVRIKCFKGGFLTYYTFGPNFEVKEYTEPIYKFKKIVYDQNTRMDIKRIMGRVLDYYEDMVVTANNDHQIDFLKGFSEFLIRTGSLMDFFAEWSVFFTRVEAMPERRRQLSQKEYEKYVQDILLQYRFYSSFILFVLCSIEFETFQKLSESISEKQGAVYNRTKKFVVDLNSRKDELTKFIRSMMQENREFAALVMKVRNDVSNWTPEKFEEFLRLLNMRTRNPDRPGGGNGGPNKTPRGPNI